MEDLNELSVQLHCYAAKYPDLIFANNGYDELPTAVVERHKDAIEGIGAVLKQYDRGFVRFQNFKIKPLGLAVRYQTHYDDRFVGVSYVYVDDVSKSRPVGI